MMLVLLLLPQHCGLELAVAPPGRRCHSESGGLHARGFAVRGRASALWAITIVSRGDDKDFAISRATANGAAATRKKRADIRNVGKGRSLIRLPSFSPGGVYNRAVSTWTCIFCATK